MDKAVTFIFCPAEDCLKPTIGDTSVPNPGYMGSLHKPLLSTPPEATILHLKRFLVSVLIPQGSPSEVVICCRYEREGRMRMCV